MRKKKKSGCSCTPQHEVCNSSYNDTVNSCKPMKTYKKPVKKYVDCSCNDYETICVDKCANLAKQAEELFERALECECKASEAYEQARECEKSSKILSAKAEELIKKANYSEKESKASECKAKELMEKSEKLCEQAKCLFKEAGCIEKEAHTNCEQAKCLFEKAQDHNKQAKSLYSQAMKCDEKALECFKDAGEKIKEYEMKSKKCEDMMEKCMNKLDGCNNKPKCNNYIQMDCKYDKCKNESMNNNKWQTSKCDDDIIYIDMDNNDNYYTGSGCSTYVSPMYDMYNMQCVGNFSQKYPSLEMPYMNMYMEQCEDINDMWMNYYTMMQNMMMQSMPKNRNLD